ncbi:hypothetical protein N7447_006182 [Penicillium robsamsonii]|uniref:uncharacterized protein n=1 Tax=Penicillium robsamsonii TaxID=1792511 RepID=UPI002548E9C0|nr:uncharacterized protein N7447_006182 [Penicillium robsamsonii]KAJ5823842.1 hypothetical protein N7447_006182 [Penicillium robsamsonii]
MGRVSIPIVLAGFAGYAFASIHHHAHNHLHHHRHRNLMPPTEDLELQNLGWDNANNTPDDFVVESITITTTTTVFGKCAPTNTIHSTLTLVKHSPEPTPWSPDHHMLIIPRPEPYQDHWDQLQPEPIRPALTNKWPAQPHYTHPGPWAPGPTQAEETTTVSKTQTVTKTATNTITVTVHPGASHLPLAKTLPGNPSEAEKAVPLAETLPNGSLEEEKAVPARRPPPPPHKNTGGSPNAGFNLPNLPVVNEILPGPKSHRPTSLDWTETPPAGQFSTAGFGGRTSPKAKGAKILYQGNVGRPWGSNIITVSQDEAHAYKYVAQFTGANDEPWTVVVWNKIGPDGKMTGWYGHSALTFTIAPGDTHYVAFDEDSEGAWGAAPGDHLPTDQYGGYSCTWGEFTFGDGENNGWSGWDVSAIQAQVAKQPVQGMSICQADGKKCSIITAGAKKVTAAYTKSVKHIDGIGGEAVAGPVRLKVILDYRG